MMKKLFTFSQFSLAILVLIALTGCRAEPVPVTPVIIAPILTATPEPPLLPTPTLQIFIIIEPTPTEQPAQVVIEFPPTPTPTSPVVVILPETGADLTGGAFQPSQVSPNLQFGSLGLILLGVFLFAIGFLFRRR